MSAIDRFDCTTFKMLPYVSFTFLHWVKFCSGCFRQVFFQLGGKKVVAGHVRQVVVLFSNDCMGICLAGLCNGHLDEWSSYRGGHLNRFDCIDDDLESDSESDTESGNESESDLLVNDE